MPRLFVSWSGDVGKQLATGLRDTVLSYPELDPFVSAVDIRAGQPWFQAINAALADATVGVVLLTRHAQFSSWVGFEAGYLFAKLQSCVVLRCGESARGPLDIVQGSDALDQASLIEAMSSILLQSGLAENVEPARAKAERWVNYQWEHWMKHVKAHLREPDELDASVTDLMARLAELPRSSRLPDGRAMRQIIHLTLQKAYSATELDTRHQIAAVHYPHYLLALQRLGARVRALALLEREEFFWQLELGRRLAETTHPDSERTFIFDNIDQLAKYYDVLCVHADRYNVFAISRDAIAKIIPTSKDFSIISFSDQDRVLAEYDQRQPVTGICFESEPTAIKQHERFLADVKKAAVRVSRSTPLEKLREQVFARALAPYTRRPVEMSEYISVREYDLHEDKHAYYVEMMSRMMDKVTEHRKRSGQTKSRMLEFGAGTGIFTRRLAELANVELHVVEIDWHCYHMLVDKFVQCGASQIDVSENGREHRLRMPNGNLVVTHNEDSRRYNPPGKFDFVLSSFADHHIKASDKRPYFENVSDNLLPGALFVVGDEFLREHDANDEDAWKQALHAYHEHIIALALQGGHRVLAALEEKALRSGLARRGDFKVSTQQYQSLLCQNLVVVDCECIGPPNAAEIGGVYVYVVRLATDLSLSVQQSG
jgi:SAM-dependent methyltransferase